MEEGLLQTIILGIIQGASEFLPISSSGHLVIAPWIFGWEDPGLAFDVALHFGTLVAVLAFFWRDWIMIFKLALKNNYQLPISNFQKNSKPQISNYNAKILWILTVATIPGVLAGFFLEDLAQTVFRHPLLIAFNLAFWGLILYLADKFYSGRKNIREVGWLDGLIAGLAQAVAIVPGTSRSGITITAGLARGLDRASAARFSFLMLTPVVLGAAVKNWEALINNFSLILFLGILFSALSGYFAIKFLLKFVVKVNYKIFFWYRLLLAMVIVAFVWFR